MSRVELQPSFILHQRPYRDTSLILEVLAFNHGRVGIVARGARGSKKNTAAQLQPFRQLLLSWSGRGELVTLTGVEEATTSPLPARLKGTALYCGYYINELAVKLLPRDDPHPEVFAIYNETLQNLQMTQPDVEPALRRYELTMLAALGYQVVTNHDVFTGEAIDPAESYCYTLDRGPTLVEHAGADVGVNVSGETLLSLAAESFSSPVVRTESRRLLRALIDHQLDGRPLKSRELFLAMRADFSTGSSK